MPDEATVDNVEAADGKPTVSLHRWKDRALFDLPHAFMRQIPLFLVYAVLVAAFVLIYLNYWRRGSVLIGGACILAGFLRAVLPEDYAGLLAVRSRWFDALFLFVIGAAIAFAAMSVLPY
jgi:hypothetical protein